MSHCLLVDSVSTEGTNPKPNVRETVADEATCWLFNPEFSIIMFVMSVVCSNLYPEIKRNLYPKAFFCFGPPKTSFTKKKPVISLSNGVTNAFPV